jgi:hypothetical protein
MDCALLVEKSIRALHGKNPFVPNVGMNVQPLIARKPETDEIIWLDIVSWKSQRHQVRVWFQRKEQLATIRMVVRMPKQNAFRQSIVRLARRTGIRSVTEDVFATDRLIFAIQEVSFPLRGENPLLGPSFIPAVGVNWPPSSCRPANNLDLATIRSMDQLPVPAQRFVGCVNHGHVDPLQSRRDPRIQVIWIGVHRLNESFVSKQCLTDSSTLHIESTAYIPVTSTRQDPYSSLAIVHDELDSVTLGTSTSSPR